MEMSLKNLLLAGIGSVAYTYEKSSALIDELVKKGELTISQGKELNEELKRKLKFGNEEKMSGESISAEKLKEILAGLNLATKEDLAEIKERIDKLENK